jgi:cytochrome oxidase assembly protein ShyY1
MTLRRITIAATLLAALGVWQLAGSEDHHCPAIDPIRVETAVEGGTREDAFSRHHSGRSTHWRHVVVGNTTSLR